MSFWKGCSSALARLSRPQSTTLLHHKSVLPTLYPYLSLHSKFHTSVSLHDAFKIPRPTPRSQPTQSSQSHQSPTAQSPQPAYELTFTCTPCTTRSTHRVSKQGYHHGSVLITCPECKNRHVISDHLKVCRRPPLTLVRESLMTD